MFEIDFFALKKIKKYFNITGSQGWILKKELNNDYVKILSNMSFLSFELKLESIKEDSKITSFAKLVIENQFFVFWKTFLNV